MFNCLYFVYLALFHDCFAGTTAAVFVGNATALPGSERLSFFPGLAAVACSPYQLACWRWCASPVCARGASEKRNLVHEFRYSVANGTLRQICKICCKVPFCDVIISVASHKKLEVLFKHCVSPFVCLSLRYTTFFKWIHLYWIIQRMIGKAQLRRLPVP